MRDTLITAFTFIILTLNTYAGPGTMTGPGPQLLALSSDKQISLQLETKISFHNIIDAQLRDGSLITPDELLNVQGVLFDKKNQVIQINKNQHQLDNIQTTEQLIKF